MDGEAHVGSVPALQALEGALGHFAAELLQNLRAAEMEIRRKMAELEERSRQCQLQVVRLEIEYHSADDEDRSYISQQLEEADERLRNIRHWQKEVEEHRQTFKHHADQIKAIVEQDTPKARNFLRRKIDELNSYTACQMSYPASSVAGGLSPMSAVAGADSPRLSPVPNCSGFEQSHLMSDDDVKDFLRKHIPLEHRLPTRIINISYTDVYRREGKMITTGDSLPLSADGPMAIFVYRQSPSGNSDRFDMERVLAHEIGHAVYAYGLDRGTKSKWNNISKQNRPNKEDDSGLYGSVSEYAAKDPIEDFAESYACYIKEPVYLYDTNKRKYDLLHEVVFDRKEYR